MKSLPIWAERLRRSIAQKSYLKQIERDLIEIYNYDVKTVGEKGNAEIYHYLCPILQTRDLFKKQISLNTNSVDMISNYFKIAYRHLVNSKAFSLMNAKDKRQL